MHQETPRLDDKTAKRAAQPPAAAATPRSGAAAARATAKAGGKGGGKKQARGGKGAKKPAGAAAKGKRAPAVDPKAAAWCGLFAALDERLKAKKVSLDDVHRGAALLPPRQLQMLSSIVSAAPARELPSKLLAGNEPLAAARAALQAAAAAAALRAPAAPGAGGGGAGEWRGRGLGARLAMDAGFTAGQLLRGGYCVAEVMEASDGDRVGLRRLRAAGIGAADLLDARDAGAGPLAGLDGRACALALRGAGFGAAALAREGHRVSAWEVRLAALAEGGDSPGAARAAAPAPAAQTPAAGGGGARAAGAGAGPGSWGGGPGCGAGDGRSGGGGCGGSGVLLGEDALEYLRSGLAGVMRMRPEADLTPLLLGTARRGGPPGGGRGGAEPCGGAAAQQPAPASPARARGARGGPLSPRTPGGGRLAGVRAR
ncbi:MAG: hypothetical protein J3K34DRAFT_506935 [Monoraphidium minutum]|nr:MAG: hypothetical protein J3K34DRAFT_506935 [Monoraphidium minutum]